MPTLQKIADLAKVDVSIVSRILHKRDYRRASPATRARIEKVARDLGYEPNALARSLVRRKTDMVGLLIPDLYEPAFIRYLEIMDGLFANHSMHLLPFLTYWSPEREERLLRMAGQRLVDGVISLFYNPEKQELYETLSKRGCPLVFRSVDTGEGVCPFDNVMVDIGEGAYVLTRHLLENGFRRVAMLGGFGAEDLVEGKPPLHPIASGYVRACREANLPVDPSLAIVCEDDGTDVAAKLSAILRNGKPFDALLVQSNSKLPGVYRAMAECGLKIGRDIGVVSITDSEFCHLTETPITVYDQPISEICEALVELFLQRLKDRDAPSRQLHFPSKLLVRASSLPLVAPPAEETSGRSR